MAIDSRVSLAVNIALTIAADNSHGYNQGDRWGPDYDCSSFVVTSFDNAGFNIRANGGSYTGNLAQALTKTGFTNVRGIVNTTTQEGLQRGDILLRPTGYYPNRSGHVAIYLGNDQPASYRIVDAQHDERGNSSGGQSGDQTGQEIARRPYYVRPDWPYVFRWTDGTGGGGTLSSTSIIKIPKRLKRGYKAIPIYRIQMLLKSLGFYTGNIDGDFGAKTESAVLAFQEKQGIEADGIIGPITYIHLLGLEDYQDGN